MKISVKPNLIDKIVLAVAPMAGMQRMIAREKMQLLHYGASESSRARGDSRVSRPPEASSNQIARIRMMHSARDLVDNVGFVRSIMWKIATYVCGSLRYQAATGDKTINDEYEQYLQEWFRICDVTGLHTFRELMQLALISAVRDGDIGFIIHNGNKETGEPMKLQGIEADRIGGIYQTTATMQEFGGVKIDTIGRPTAFTIYDRTPNMAYINPRDISAASFIHFFDPMRIDQYRGITAFATAIENLKDVREILEFEKMAVKWGSAQSGVIWSETGADESGYSFDTSQKDTNNNAMNLQSVEPGVNRILSPGERVEMFKNDRPSTVFAGFMELLYREVAHSFNLPYGFVHDLSNLGGPTARLESAQAQRSFARWQMLLEEKLMTKIVLRALADGINQGKIQATPNWMRGKWIFPAHPTIDVGRESASNINENRQGLKTAAEIFAEQGRDVDEEQDQLAIEAENMIVRAQEVAKRTGVTFEVALNLMVMKTPNGNGAPASAQEASGNDGGGNSDTQMTNGHSRLPFLSLNSR